MKIYFLVLCMYVLYIYAIYFKRWAIDTEKIYLLAVVMPLFVYLFVKNGYRIKAGRLRVHYVFLVFFVIYMMSSLISMYNYGYVIAVKHFVYHVLPIIFAVMFGYHVMSYLSFNRIVDIYVLGAFIASAVVVLVVILSGDYLIIRFNAFDGGYMDGLFKNTLMANSNALSRMLLIGLILILFSGCNIANKYIKLCVVIFGILLTLSKSVIMMAVVLLLAYLFKENKDSKYWFGLSGMILIGYYMYEPILHYLDMFLQNVEEQSSTIGSFTLRPQIYLASVQVFFDNMLFGVGAGNSNIELAENKTLNVLMSLLNKDSVPEGHSLYLKILMEGGVILFSVFSFLLYVLFKVHKNVDVSIFAIFIVFLLTGFITDNFGETIFWFFIGVGLFRYNELCEVNINM